MILVSQTYEVVTPESAEHGESDETGYEFENQEYSFRDLVELMREHPEASDYPLSETSWFSSHPDHGSREYFERGEERSTAIHFSRENPERLRKYWIKAARFAGIK